MNENSENYYNNKNIEKNMKYEISIKISLNQGI